MTQAGPALVIAAVIAYLLAGTAALLLPGHRRPVGVLGGAAVISAAVALIALARIGLGGDAALTLPVGLPWLPMRLRLDGLSAVFLLILHAPAAATSVFALGYVAHEPEPQRILPAYPLFLAAMTLVVLADDAFTFLASWESMSLASWALVLANHRKPDTPRAGLVYLAMAGIGTMCLLLAFGLLAGGTGDYGFATLRAASRGPWLAAAIGGLALVGCGSKAGLVPLHAWLPLAHPAAPAPVSALMSGVMTKVALYGLVRLLFDLAAPQPWGIGAALMVAGGLGAVLGLMQAVVEPGLKRLLAFSTVENVGVVAIGLGLALVYRAFGLAPAAALALAAGLLHALNHALFKTLWFCISGATMHAVGSDDLAAYGGLIRRMPKIAGVALVAALAAAGLPPLNGFLSEWLTFQAILASPDLPQPLLRLGVPFVGTLLALAAGLAAVCFVRLFGIAFLGRPRSPEAAAAGDPPAVMTGPLTALAAACGLLGLVPGLGLWVIRPAIEQLLQGPQQIDWVAVAPGIAGGYAPLGLALLAGALVLILGLWLVRSRVPAPIRGPAWDCGTPDAGPATQYGPASFGQPVRRMFGTVLEAQETVAMPPPGAVGPARLEVVLGDRVWRLLYLPPARLVLGLSDRLNPLQFLSIRRYLTFSAGMLLILLILVVVAT